VRFDHRREYNPEGTLSPTRFAPGFSYARQDDVPDWWDIYPRLGIAYDLFGNGRTAIKASLGQYVNHLNQAELVPPPVNALVTTATRTWNDRFYPAGDARSGNFAPDCDLTNPGTNGECGALSNSRFGQVIPVTRADPNLLTGWGKRPHSWQGSISVQHELGPKVGLNVAYFRRSYGNFILTQNAALAPGDFSPFCVTAPLDSRLPDGGGYEVCGLFDVNPAQFGRTDNVRILSSDLGLGDVREVYNGFEVNVQARFGRGGVISGGASAGTAFSDACEVARGNPQVSVPLAFAGIVPTGTGPAYATGPSWPTQFCRPSYGYGKTAQAKVAVIYPLPWDTEISTIVQNLPGVDILANRVYSNAEIAPSLGRSLSACPAVGVCNATVSIPLVSPRTCRRTG
jgi:hypothetical protein